jgi:outer membrane protein assembly factor BamB
MNLRSQVSGFFLLVITLHCSGQTRMWTHFRGNELNAIAENASYPDQWSDSINIDWKVEIPGRAWSSPVVYGDQIWCTSATKDGKAMFAECIDFNTGKETFHVDLFHPDSVFRIHAVNSYATPTPCIEENFVYVNFGRYGTACIETATGKVLWKRSDLQCDHIQGSGSSLFIYKDKLIVHMEGTDVQNIYALDKRTGKVIWKTQRPLEYYDDIPEIGRKAYITPIIVKVKGKDLLISNGSAVCIAYDPETGEEVWRIPQGEDSTISMPVYYDGWVYFYTSFVTPPEGQKYCELMAVDPDGKGDISETNIKWRVKSPMLQLLTPVIYDGLLYTIDAKSKLICMDVKTGNEIWSEQLKGKYNSSPVFADGKIYFCSTRGNTLVYKAGSERQFVAENELDGEIWATPVFLVGNILLRTSNYLYKISNQEL